MRVIPTSELAILSPEVPEEEKRIYVDLANQLVTAFEGDKAAFVTRCASGAKGTETPLGEFRTYHKGPSVHWHNDYGRPSSRGCVNLTSKDAKYLYRWTRPEVPVGTPYLSQPGAGTVVYVVPSAQ